MSIGLSSLWRCEEDCPCGQSLNNKRCRHKISFLHKSENIPNNIFNVLYKLDLGIDAGQVRFGFYWRRVISKWMWGNKDVSDHTRHNEV